MLFCLFCFEILANATGVGNWRFVSVPLRYFGVGSPQYPRNAFKSVWFEVQTRSNFSLSLLRFRGGKQKEKERQMCVCVCGKNF